MNARTLAVAACALTLCAVSVPTVENGAGNLSRSADKGAKETARASIRKTYAGNHAYYRFVK